MTSVDHRPPVEGAEPLLTPAEVAAAFRVDPKTVTRWAAAERLSCIRTPGGHRRFRAAEVAVLLAGARDPQTFPGAGGAPEPATSGGFSARGEGVGSR